MKERVYTLTLSSAYEQPRTKRARKAIEIIRVGVARHMKVKEDAVRIDGKIGEYVFSRGMKKPPRRVKVMVSVEEGYVNVRLADVKSEKKIKEEKSRGGEVKDTEQTTKPERGEESKKTGSE
ncbi:MAG: 50S ribosomal protein L31e [Candidatus Micrarchaeia archaeon]